MRTRKLWGPLAQGIYGLVLGAVFLAFIPFDLPLSIIALIPAILALGFGAVHIRDAIIDRYPHLSKQG